MSGNEIIDLTSDNEPIERPRRITPQKTRQLTRQFRPMENNAETSHKSGQTDEIMITETKIQNSCTVCLEKFTKIKSMGGEFWVTSCGHLFCWGCINMICESRPKFTDDHRGYINCPTCRRRIFNGGYHRVYL